MNLLKQEIKKALLIELPVFHGIALRSLQLHGTYYQKQAFLKLEIERVYSLIVNQKTKPTSS